MLFLLVEIEGTQKGLEAPRFTQTGLESQIDSRRISIYAEGTGSLSIHTAIIGTRVFSRRRLGLLYNHHWETGTPYPVVNLVIS